MASTHYQDTKDDFARHRAAAGQPMIAGLGMVVLVGAIAIFTHALITGQQTSGFWRLDALLGSVGLILLLLASVMVRTGDRRRVSPSDAGAFPREAGARRGVRRHRRFVPKYKATTLTTFDGRSIVARVVDVSMGGVAVEAILTDLEFATVARVGSRAAGPVRRTANGAVFTFNTLLDPVIVNEDLVL